MATLSFMDQQQLEKLFDMGGGYVLNFSDRTFQEFVADAVQLDIHDAKYCKEGTSKARKLRQFWGLESDFVVGTLLQALMDYRERCPDGYGLTAADEELIRDCWSIANRLLSNGPRTDGIEQHAQAFNAKHLQQQISRMDAAVETDPSLAIGTAKELIETCCKTILEARGVDVDDNANIPALTKLVLHQLELVPDNVSHSSRGGEATKRVVQSLASTIGGLAELRNLYGTGHGKSGQSAGLTPRHARLTVGASVAVAGFLFDTHMEQSTEV